jgi:hypothetical protein
VSWGSCKECCLSFAADARQPTCACSLPSASSGPCWCRGRCMALTCFLFCGSEGGSHRAALICSLIETAQPVPVEAITPAARKYAICRTAAGSGLMRQRSSYNAPNEGSRPSVSRMHAKPNSSASALPRAVVFSALAEPPCGGAVQPQHCMVPHLGVSSGLRAAWPPETSAGSRGGELSSTVHRLPGSPPHE